MAMAGRLHARLRLERAGAFLAVAVLLLALVLSGEPRGIPVLGAVAGAAVAVLTYRLRQVDEAVTDLRRRQQEREGIASALLAEILDNMRGAHRTYRYVTLAGLLDRMRSEPGYLPYLLPDDASARVHEALIERLPLLPREVISAVVSYYAADAALNRAIAALQDPGLKALERQRQVLFVEATFRVLGEVYPVPDPGLPEAARMAARRGAKAWKAARVLHRYAAVCRAEVEALRQLELR